MITFSYALRYPFLNLHGRLRYRFIIDSLWGGIYVSALVAGDSSNAWGCGMGKA